MFGNAHGTYYGTGNKSVFGWYGYALNKIVYSIAAMMQVTEAETRALALHRPFGEALDLSEALFRPRSRSRGAVEGLSLWEGTGVARQLNRAVSATLALLEAALGLPKKVTIVILRGEAILVAEVQTRSATLIRRVAHIVQVAETYLWEGPFIRSLVLGGARLGALLRAVVRINRR